MAVACKVLGARKGGEPDAARGVGPLGKDEKWAERVEKLLALAYKSNPDDALP